jgi:tetratricopeptide (TPR) repeat protein
MVRSGNRGMPDRYHTELLRAAEAICTGHLDESCSEANLFYFCGLLAAKNEQEDFAIECLTRAAALDPGNVDCLVALAAVLGRNNDLPTAESVCRRAIALEPTNCECYRCLGHIQAQLGRAIEAIATYERALALQPTNPAIHSELGDVLTCLRRFEEALEHYERALQLAPDDHHVYRRLGEVHLRKGNGKSAVSCFRLGLDLKPKCADLHIGLGKALLDCRSYEAALNAFQSAITVDSSSSSAFRHLGYTFELLRRPNEAATAWFRFGDILERAGRLREAARSYRRAIDRRPDYLAAHVSLGHVLLQMAEPHQAARCLEKVVGLDPRNHVAHVHLGSALHALGDFDRAWDELESYHALTDRPEFEQPAWDGSPIRQQAIMLWTDGAAELTVQYLRYVPLVKERVARVVVECERPLAPLVSQMACVDTVVVRGTPRPAFEVHAPVRSLPRLFQTQRQTIPNRVPYLAVSSQLTAEWHEQVARTLAGERTDASSEIRKVGIAWIASHRLSASSKHLTLASFGSLARVSHVRLVSLQFGSDAIEQLAPPPDLRVDRVLNDVSTPTDIAALMLNLDLIITADNLVAHLAGALARPVWTLVPHSPRWWLWHSDNEASLWYPTMRLFRQGRAEEWSRVLERVCHALSTVA